MLAFLYGFKYFANIRFFVYKSIFQKNGQKIIFETGVILPAFFILSHNFEKTPIFVRSFIVIKIIMSQKIVKYGDVIHVDLEILGGTPVFCGTRVPVKNLFDYLETGETVDDFLRDFESVKRYQALRVLELSKKLLETSSSILYESVA